jgi:MFS family permease
MSERATRPTTVLLAIMVYWGYAFGVNGAAAPFLAQDFGLDSAGIARAFGWISTGALGTFAFARAVDRLGRRRTLLACCALLPVAALASAVAPSPATYVLAQIVAQALIGTLLMTVVVIVAEELPTERRAAGQGLAGVAGAAGNGLPFVLAAALATVPGSWRWLWVAAALPLLAVPLLARALPETGRWEQAAAKGAAARARAADLFLARYRRRSLGVLAAGTLLQLGLTSTQTWLFYHPVHLLGLSPALATAVLIGGGAVGLVGYPLGGRLADRWGRRAAFCGSLLVSNVALAAYYWVPGPPGPSAALGLAFTFIVGIAAANAAAVAFRSSLTELFPTALRGTVQGALAVCAAAAAVAAHFGVAVLTPSLHGLAGAITVLAALGSTAALVFAAVVPETAGIDLECASLDDDVGLAASRVECR